MEYLPRVVDDELDLRLDAFGATLIMAAKAGGAVFDRVGAPEKGS